MEIFLIKSAACLVIFYAFYKLFLERENMHQMKRFYLLGAVLASFLIPLVTFTEYIEMQVTTIPVFTEGFVSEIPEIVEVATNYWPTVLWSIYTLGVLFFSLKFGRNLYSIIQKIRKNPLFKNDNIFHVLLKTPTTPHTFFSYIFLNKRKFEAQEIPEEVLLHEQAHAKEFHSMDVILMELLQIVLWFNPFLYFFKHSIKLNHEFLADRAVLNKGVETACYQNILLAFSSNASAPELANSINYSFIKKRFTVMKTSTSKRAVWLRSLILLPLLGLLIYGFSTTEVKVKDVALDAAEIADYKATPQEVAQYNKLASFWNKRFEEDSTNRVMPLSELKKLETIYRSMTIDQRYDAQPFPDCGITQENNNDTIPTARSIDIQIEANGTYLVEGMSATKNNLAQVVGRLHQDLTPAIRNHMMNIHITNPREPSRAEVQFIFESLKAYGFYRLVAGNQEVVRGKGNTPMKSESLGTLKNKVSWEKATKEQIAEYNKLAKKYNDMPQDNMIIKGKELTRMRYLYDLMTLEQRKNAEPYPNIPPPPPAPDARPAPGAVDAPPPIVVIKGVNDGDPNIPPPPPPPPAPEDPLDHIINMAKKGATFYYEGKEVTSDKAIEVFKKNKKLNVHTRGENSTNPVVKITKKPIQLKKSKSVAFESGNTRSLGGEKNLFYVRVGDQVTYYDQYGSTVNIQGKPVPELNKSPFVYNGQRISPQEANRLLQQNRSLAPAAQKNKDGYYSILLNSHTNNASKNDYNNLSSESSSNLNTKTSGPFRNPIVVFKNIIENGDAFFLKNKKISKKEALKLYKANPRIQVRSVNNDDGTSNVYLNNDGC